MEDVNAQIQYDLEALGDFPPSEVTHETLVDAAPLLVPGATATVALTASNGFADFIGLGAPSADLGIDVSLWPAAAPCALPLAGAGCDYPATGTGDGYSLGVSADGRTLLVAGGDASAGGDDALTRSIATSAVVVDLATSKIACVPASRGLQAARAGATITALGDKLLVAGGRDPLQGGAAVSSAEIFDPATGGFEPDPVALRTPRSRHGAVRMASGEVLLVGGVSQSGDPIRERTLEAIAPDTPYHRSNVTELPVPRVDPVVLRLTDDRILVAGGNDGEEPPAPLPDLVWLDSKARSVVQMLPVLACSGDQAGPGPTETIGGTFVAMPGGAILAAGGCTMPLDDTSLACDDRGACGSGCPSAEVFWIDRDGDVTCCGQGRTTCSGPAPQDAPAGFVDPHLLPGSAGRPFLVEGAAGARSLRRFDPWSGEFPSSGIAVEGAVATAATADAGLFFWIDDCKDDGAPCATLVGLRHGLRSPYTQAVAPLLLADTEGISPDRAPSPPPSAGAAASRPFRDPASGDVGMTPGSELLLTDTTYAAVDVVVHVRNGPVPLLRLGASEYGGKACPFPVRAPQPPYDAELLRKGGTVTLTVDRRSRECDAPDGRVSIAIAAGSDPVTIRSVSVTRIAE